MNLVKPRALFSRRGYEVKVWLVCEDAAESMDDLAFSRPDVVVDFFEEHVSAARWFDPEKECMIVLCLNRRNLLKCWNLVSLGTASSSLCAPREVFRPAIVASATAIIVLHNHPSGDPSPSFADVGVTRQLRAAAQTVDIDLLDHIIVGRKERDPNHRGYYSFREAGILEAD